MADKNNNNAPRDYSIVRTYKWLVNLVYHKKNTSPDYAVDRIYTWLGNFIYPVDELYDGFYKRFWLRWNVFGASTNYPDLIANFKVNGVRRGLTRDLGPRLSHIALRVALLVGVVVSGVALVLFRAQYEGMV